MLNVGHRFLHVFRWWEGLRLRRYASWTHGIVVQEPSDPWTCKLQLPDAGVTFKLRPPCTFLASCLNDDVMRIAHVCNNGSFLHVIDFLERGEDHLVQHALFEFLI